MNTSKTSSYTPTFDEIVWVLAEIFEYEGDDGRLANFQKDHILATSLAFWLKYKNVSGISDFAAEMIVRSFYSYCDYTGLSSEEVILSSEQPEIYDEEGELVRPAQPSQLNP